MDERVNDAELVARAEQGERAAFDALFDRYYDVVVAAAYKVLGNVDAARDCAQDAFLDAAGTLSELRDKSKFASWIYNISYRKAIAQVRRAKVHTAAMVVKKDESRALIPLGTPIEQAERAEKLASIRRALNDVPDNYREVLILKLIDGRSHEDIAAILNLSHAAVDKRLTRGKEMLRESLRRWQV